MTIVYEHVNWRLRRSELYKDTWYLTLVCDDEEDQELDINTQNLHHLRDFLNEWEMLNELQKTGVKTS